MRTSTCGGQRVVDAAAGRRVDQLGEHRRKDRGGPAAPPGRSARAPAAARRPRGRSRTAPSRRPSTSPGCRRASLATSASPRRRHVAGLLPQPPRQRHRRQPWARRCAASPSRKCWPRVVGLPRRADDTGHRREHHERRQIRVVGQLVQVPRRIDLGPQHRIDAVGGQRRRRPRRRGRPPRGSPRTADAAPIGEDRASAARSAASAATTRHLRAGGSQFGDEFGRAGASGPRRDSSVRWRTPWCSTTWRATRSPPCRCRP